MGKRRTTPDKVTLGSPAPFRICVHVVVIGLFIDVHVIKGMVSVDGRVSDADDGEDGRHVSLGVLDLRDKRGLEARDPTFHPTTTERPKPEIWLIPFCSLGVKDDDVPDLKV